MDDQVLEELAVLLVDRLVEVEEVRDPLDVDLRGTPARRPCFAGSAGMMKKMM